MDFVTGVAHERAGQTPCSVRERSGQSRLQMRILRHRASILPCARRSQDRNTRRQAGLQQHVVRVDLVHICGRYQLVIREHQPEARGVH